MTGTHPIDHQTLLRAIDLLDRYNFILQDDKTPEGREHLKYTGVVLHNLRNAMKFNAQILIEDDQAYHGGRR